MNTKASSILFAAMTMLAISACTQDQTEAPDQDAPASSAEQGAGGEMDSAAPAKPDSAAGALPRAEAPEGARVYFVTPEDGATVSSPVRIEFGIEGMDVVAAGIQEPDSGHHHLLVDTDLPPPGQPIPADAQHIHFGDASTETELELEPGEHSLQLLLGDYLHIPHNPPVASDVITITVE